MGKHIAKHIALKGLDSCVYTHPAYLESHQSMLPGSCMHTHTAWGECPECLLTKPAARHKKEADHAD